MKKRHIILPLCLLFTLGGCIKYNGLPPEEAEHQHEYAETYSFDEKEHWFAATCGHEEQRKGVEAHSFGDFTVTQEPTLAKEGLKVRTCSICNYKDEVVLPKLGEEGQQGGSEQGGGQTTPEWTITGINLNRDNIELTVGDNPISVVPTIAGEGKFPTSLNVKCDDVTTIETVDGEEVTKTVKIAEVSSNVVESGSAFTVRPIAAGNTKITVTSVGKTDVSKEINVVVNPKIEIHELTLSESSLEMNKGSIRVLGCESTDNVTWTTSDDSIVALENKTNSGVWLKSLKASGDTPVTITATICAGTEYEVVKTCLVTVISTDQTIFDYYFINNLGLKDLHLYMWGECGTNADWPGVSMGESTFKDKSYNDVYKITIDTDVKPYEKIIISGKDYNDEFLQTNDIVLASFKTQNAFSIPELPSAGSDGVRKASIKMSNFNPDTDILEGGYITLSMNEADVLVGGTLDVITYTSEETVEYTLFNGTGKVELSNKSKNGFTVKGLEAGTAEIHASIEVDGKLISSKLYLTVIEDREVTYYFANNYQWKNLRVYLWGTKGENAPFPGVMFSAAPVKNKDGVNTYSLSFNVYSDGYTNLIISGTDEVHGWSQTKDILCSDMDINGNMIYITEENWDVFDHVGEKNIYKCNYSYGTFEPFGPYVSFEEDNKQVIAGQTVDIPVSSNTEYEIINSDDTVVEVTKGENKITVKGLKEGEATITAKVDDNIKDSITISVVEDYEVCYYFANNYNWSDLHVYMWNDALHTENAPFPGVTLGERSFIDGNGDYIYKITFNRYADNYDGFIISGVDSGKEGRCQTENVLVSGFGDNNGVRISGWKDGVENVATTSYGFYFYELYLNIASSVEFNVGASVPITVKTNGENVAYQITSGNDVIELQNESDTGVTIKGLSVGTATFTATVTDGTHTVTKTITVNVEADVECTYYFVNEYEWTNVKAYLYVDENNNNQWPGASMTLLGTDERGKEIYTISFQKYSDGYKGMVINGHDVTKNNDAKTKDIVFNSLDSGNNCISVTGWEDEENLVADYSTSIINDYVLLSDYSVDMKKDATKNISFVSSKAVTIQNTNSSAVQTTLNDGYVTLTALEAGTATITLTVGTGENAVSKSCTVTVTRDEPDYVTYYFANSYLWSDLKVYLWNATESNGEFPGEALTATPVKNSEGHDTYAITFDRNEHDWTNCIISGIDGSHGWAKTYDISFAGLDADNTNMVTINETGWTEVDHPGEGQNIYKCTYATGVFAEFVPDVSISDSTKTVKVGSTIEITVTANTNFVVESSDNETVEVTTNGNKISIKGIKEGQTTIDVYVDKDGPKEKKVSCVVTVEEATQSLTTYTITNIPDWYPNDGAELYVCVFDADDNATWIPVEYDNGTVSFTSEFDNYVKVVLVRRDPAIDGDPTWDNIWNQSADLFFSNFTVAFVAK